MPRPRNLPTISQRVLEGKPTVARPPTLLDRTARWAQRHREVVAVAGLIGLLALLGLTASTLLIAREQRKTAQNFDLGGKAIPRGPGHGGTPRHAVLRSVWPTCPGAAQIRQDLLRQTLGYYRGFVEQAKDNPELRADLALTYSKIGTLSAEIGSSADAIDADKQAIELSRNWPRRIPATRTTAAGWASARTIWPWSWSESGRTDEARRAFAEAIRLQEEVLGSAEDSGQCLADLALAHGNLGLLQNETGDAEGAAASLARAVGLQEQLLGAAPDNPERLRNLAATLNNLGALYAERQPAKAIEQYEKAAAMQKKAVELRPEESVYRSELALTYNNLGAVQSRSGAVAQAAESYARVVDLAGELVRQSPAQKSYRRTLAVGFNNLGLAQSKLGHAAAAEPSFRHALALQETLVKQDPAGRRSAKRAGRDVQQPGHRSGRIEPSGGCRQGLSSRPWRTNSRPWQAPRRLPGIGSFSASTTSTTAGHCGKRAAPPTPPGPPWHHANYGPRIHKTDKEPFMAKRRPVSGSRNMNAKRQHGCDWNAWRRAACSRRSAFPGCPP